MMVFRQILHGYLLFTLILFDEVLKPSGFGIPVRVRSELYDLLGRPYRPQKRLAKKLMYEPLPAMCSKRQAGLARN